MQAAPCSRSLHWPTLIYSKDTIPLPIYRLLVVSLITLWTVCPTVLHAAEQLQVKVRGVEGEVRENVESALSVPPGLVRDGKVDALWLQVYEKEAPDKVRTALQPFGYYKPEVRTALKKSNGESYRFEVDIKPGVPVRVVSVSIAMQGEGFEEESLNELVDEFPLYNGDILRHPTYEEAKAALRGRALALGYLDADFSVHEILISEEKTTASIQLVLDTGPRYLFGEATLPADTGYPRRFLKRYLAFRPGDAFSEEKIGETQLNFMNSDRFREIVVIAEKEKSADLRIPVAVQLRPSASQRLRVGVGYGTDTGARFTGNYRDLNLFRLGHELLLELYLAERLQGVGGGYTIPSSRGINSYTGVRVNFQREDTDTYTNRITSLEVSRSRNFGRGMLGMVYLELLHEDYTIGSDESSSILVLPGVRFSISRYDDMIRPTRGFRYSAEVRGTHQYLGSDTGFIQLMNDGSALFTLPWKMKFFVRGNVGLTVQDDPLEDLPASMRFYAGGDTSVRGYSYQSLGPRDADNNVVGGKNLLVGSVELERSLFADWGISAFFDTGNAFDSLTNIRLYSGAGVGLHYYTRVGAINLYFARQVGVRDPANHIHFTVGFEL